MGQGEPLLVCRAVPTSWAPNSEDFIHRGPTPSYCGFRGQHFPHPVLRNWLNHIQHPLICHVLASQWQLGHKWPLKVSLSPPSRHLLPMSPSPHRESCSHPSDLNPQSLSGSPSVHPLHSWLRVWRWCSPSHLQAEKILPYEVKKIRIVSTSAIFNKSETALQRSVISTETLPGSLACSLVLNSWNSNNKVELINY